MLRWNYRPRDEVASRALAEKLGLSPVVAQVLVNRGVAASADGARRFLAPTLHELHDPFLFRDMGRAAERIALAVRRGERVLIYGDYDVDGLAGTAILYRLLSLLGANVLCHVPDRMADGYGMQADRIERARAESGVTLAVSVDNGTSAFDALEAARRVGVDVIVTDHHLAEPPEPGAARPPAPPFALVNPKAAGETYPFSGLAGAGVAFKLAWAVATAATGGGRRLPEPFRSFLLDALALVALGTVADAVPLAGENRPLVAYGLRALAATASPGLRALLEVARVDPRGRDGRGTPSAEDVAFRLAPRLNAAGRMSSARVGLDLLAAPTMEAARPLAAALEAANRRRQQVERSVFEEAKARLEAEVDLERDLAVVLASESWPVGVIGIVASRIVERVHRPAVLIAIERETGRGRGSARSVPSVPIHEALARCRGELVRFGGHACAAGLEVRADRIAAFRERLLGALGELGHEAAALGPSIDIDLDVGLPEVADPGLVRDLARLSPHGAGNGRPVFAATGVELVAPPRLVGRPANHLALLVREGRTVLRAIGFGMAERLPELDRREARDGPDAGRRLAIAFEPALDRFASGGRPMVELELRDVRTATARSS